MTCSRPNLLRAGFAAIHGALAVYCFGQGPITREAVLAPPPPVSFPDWRLVDETELSEEYEEVFPSAFTSPYPVNNEVPLRIFLPLSRTGPVDTVLITHYWGATDLRAERALAADLNERGIGAAILTLPYHLDRTPPGHVSGQLAIRPDPNLLLLTMYQAEMDCRRSADFLDSRPEFKHSVYGLVGTSLGAIVASLAYGLDARFRYASFLLGGVDIAHLLWTSSRLVPVKDDLRRQGWTEDRLRQVLRPIEPSAYLPRSAPGKALVIYGQYDTVVRKESTDQLVALLSTPYTEELPTGHYGGVFVEGKALRIVSAFFAACYQDRPFRPPAKIVGPTVRIGAIAATPSILDIGAGLDLFHVDPEGRTFGSLFITPRGLRLFLGTQIGGGFYIGGVGSARGVGVGLVWSRVL